jgi:hypothetical protein
MREQLVAYFAAEKSAAWILIAAGIAALAAAAALVAARSSYRAMAWPLGLLALGELAIGGVLIARTDGQVAALLAQLARAPADLAIAELARMGPVMRNFAIIVVVELVLIGVGVGLTYVAGRRDVVFAVGVGLIAQASLLLVFDLFAVRRAERYVDLLRTVAAGPGV